MSDLRRSAQFLALAAAIITLGCGDPATLSSSRQLQSITVSPATADAQGQEVQFTATGHWSASPLTTTPQTASWGVCQNNAASTAVTVSSSGVAQCGSSAKGTYTVFAADPPFGAGANCTAITACGGGCQISGGAQLTCP
jgi:hypothetical protein